MLVAVLCVLSVNASAQDEKKKPPPRRFGYDVDEMTFPQKTPADAMKSIGVALDRKNLSYMLAHMVDPRYVDYWVDQYKLDYAVGNEEGKRLLGFDRLVHETNTYFKDDPKLFKELRLFAKETDWNEMDDVAIGAVKSLPARKVYLRRVDERWFLENRQQ